MIHTLYRIASGSECGDNPTEVGKVTQDGESSDDEPLRSRTQWSLAGQDVCFSAFCTLLGVSEHTMLRHCRGDLDLRRNLPGAPAKKNPNGHGPALMCDWFLLELYMTAAEPLPHEQYICGNIDGDIEVDDNPWLAAGVDEVHEVLALPDISQELGEWTTDRSFSDHSLLLLGDGPDELRGVPRRFLPHGRIHDLYWQFLGTWELKTSIADGDLDGKDMLATPNDFNKKSSPPSWPTFLRRWHCKWKHILRFRKISQHADCNICFKLREKVHSRVPLAAKLAFAREWRAHLRWQYYDRCIYWSHRYASKNHTGVLTIIIDSMDKCKTAMPKYRFSQRSKEIDKFVRPRVILTAALAHGYCGCVWLADEGLTHGASAAIEVLAQTIEKVWQKCQNEGKPFPTHLIVQSDNTTSQAKNNDFNLWMASLVARYHFKTTDVHYLTVGHTHEDIDQLFGLILELVLRKNVWETPEELVMLIEKSLKSKFNARGDDFFCGILPGIRDWGAWLQPLGVRLAGAFKARKGPNGEVQWTLHPFSYKRREDLHQDEKLQMSQKSIVSEESPHDVISLVKSYMHDRCLQQPPLVVLPAGRLRILGAPTPTRLILREVLLPARKEQLLQLAGMLCKEEYRYPAAAVYIRGLADPAPNRDTQLPRLNWLNRLLVAPAPMQLHDAQSSNSYFAHLPQISWNLLATFKAMAPDRP